MSLDGPLDLTAAEASPEFQLKTARLGEVALNIAPLLVYQRHSICTKKGGGGRSTHRGRENKPAAVVTTNLGNGRFSLRRDAIMPEGLQTLRH